MAEYNQEKVKALETAVAQIERQFGKGSIMRLGAQDAMQRQRDPDRLDRRSTWRSASAGCRAAGSSRSTGRSPRARRRSRCT